MKNLKKMLVAICILALLCTGVIMTVIAETAPTGTVAEAQALLDEVNAAESTSAKRTAMDALDSYITGNTFDTEADDYIAFMAAYEEAEISLRVEEVMVRVQTAESAQTSAAREKALSVLAAKPVSNDRLAEAGILDEIDAYKFEFANQYLNAVGMDVNGDTATNRINLNKLNSFLKANPLNEEHEDYEAFNTEYQTKVTEHDEATRAAFEALEEDALLSDYDLKNNIWWDMETQATSPKFVEGDAVDGGQVVLNKNPNSAASHVTEANGNTYYQLDYNQTGNGNGRHMYLTTLGTTPSDSKGLIFEFDVLTEADIPGKIRLEGGEDCDICGTRDFWCMIVIEANGAVRCGFDKSGNPLISDVVVPGEWTHFTLVFNKETYTVDVYVDYTLIGSGEVRKDKTAAEDHRHEYTLDFPRLGVDPSESYGKVGFDNFKAYGGTSIRTLDRIDNMSDVEKLAYYVGYFADESRPVSERKLAYDRTLAVAELFVAINDGVFGNEDDIWMIDGLDAAAESLVRELVATYYGYDMTAVIESLKAENLQKYMDLATKLLNMPRNPSNVSDRTTALNDVKEFLDEVGIYIYTDDADYIKANANVAAVELMLKADDLIADFVLYVNRFNNSITASLAAMNRHYNEASEVYAYLLDNPYGWDVIEEDYPNKHLYADYEQALEDYSVATEKIAVAMMDENSQKIIDCLSFISQWKTEAEWVANYTYMERYVLIIRETIYEDNYTKDYEGLDAALAVFYPINDYFYNVLQDSHIAELTRCVNKYAGSDSYIERVGLVAYMEKYLATNDIDEQRETIANLIVAFKTYKEEVEIQAENYSALLDQNTTYFVNFVEELKTCVDYASMKEVYEKAEVYYYSMNISSPDVQGAIATFDEYTALLETLEEATSLFIGYAKQISGATGDDLYTALANCCKYYDDVEVTISDEASEMYDAFTEAYEAYVSVTNAANSEIGETIIAMGSARANCGIAPVISVMIGMIA